MRGLCYCTRVRLIIEPDKNKDDVDNFAYVFHRSLFFFFFLMTRPPRNSPLFPTPPLSRSRSIAALVSGGGPPGRAGASSEAPAGGVLRKPLADAPPRLHEGEGFAQALGAARGVVPGIVL